MGGRRRETGYANFLNQIILLVSGCVSAAGMRVHPERHANHVASSRFWPRAMVRTPNAWDKKSSFSVGVMLRLLYYCPVRSMTFMYNCTGGVWGFFPVPMLPPGARA